METATLQYSDRAQFFVCWQPYFLFGSVPDEGMPFVDWMRSMMGEHAASKAENGQGRLFELSDELGLNIDPKRQLGNSMLSHCLLDFAGRTNPGVQTKLAELLFKGNLADGELISDVGFLMRSAETVNLDKEAALIHIQDASVQEAVQLSHDKAVSEIGTPKLPFSVMTSSRKVELKLAFAGDIPTSTLTAIFDKLLEVDTTD